jgi:NADPH:quinone reductase-like Zn-dependent oxidoreductase
MLAAVPTQESTMTEHPTTMRAVVHERYGPPEVLDVREVDVPAIEDDQVLVRVYASSVNPVEWYGVHGPLFARIPARALRRPKITTIGADLAGRVEAVGRDVKDLRPGDDVFGSSGVASWAEYAPARASRLARKPANISFEEAATVPVAGLTALQAVRDHAQIQPGQKVLINGAAGGVGTFAVQLAKTFGAEVTAVCRTQNVDQARTLGANHVVDYTQEDFTRRRERYDVLLDIAGSRSFLQLRRVLTPKATVVAIGAPMRAKGLGPLRHIIGMMVLAIGRSQKLKFFIAKIQHDDLAVMADYLAAGTVKPVIDRRYELTEVSEALDYLGTQHARGKIVITV